jgi:hypothetical protein
MTTIEFQKDESIKDNVIVSVNGKLHTISHKSLAIQTSDKKPLIVKIRNGYWGSKKYTFDTEDSMTLQISEDRQLTKRYQVLIITIIVFYLTLTVVACYFEGIKWFLIAQSIVVSLYPIYLAIKGKVLIIREVIIGNE